jgi:hypothetical protein
MYRGFSGGEKKRIIVLGNHSLCSKKLWNRSGHKFFCDTPPSQKSRYLLPPLSKRKKENRLLVSTDFDPMWNITRKLNSKLNSPALMILGSQSQNWP